MYMADALSRAYLEVKPDDSFDEELSCVIHSLFISLRITPTNLNEFRVATSNDSALMIIKTLCQSGWPKNTRKVPINTRIYWNICDESHALIKLCLKTRVLLCLFLCKTPCLI